MLNARAPPHPRRPRSQTGWRRSTGPPSAADLDGARLRADRPVARRARMCGAGRGLSVGRSVPQPGHHGAARLRPRRVQVLRLSAAGDDRGAAHGALSAARRDRQPLERGNGDRGALSARARGVSHALPQGRSRQADAAAPAIRPGRLQLPASGSLRRARLPAAGHGAAVASRARTSPAANSCSPSSGRACSRAPRWSRSAKARP